MSQSKTVAIIGAGAGGIVCAKVLLDDGFDVTIFERENELGGVWSSKAAYFDLHSQQPGGTLEFSDLYDGHEFAPWQHVHDYLQRYADKFHITERIQFQTRVLSIMKDDLKDKNIPWIIQRETFDGRKETNMFDFVVVATGFCSEPYKPNYRGQNNFTGSILCPSDIKSKTLLENKRVIVVGSGKSAVDMAVSAGRYAESCYMVFRKAHWLIPRKIMRGLVPSRVMFTHALSMAFTPFPGAPHSALFRYLHETFPNIFVKLMDNIEQDIISTHGPDLYNDKVFLPQHPYRNVETIAVMPTDFIQLKREGRIIGKLGTIDEIVDETTVRLDTGENLQADLIISATGYIRRFPFFSENDAQMMGFTKNGEEFLFNLYRQIVPVGIPNIGFIGYTSIINHWPTSEVASHWVSDYFLKRLKLPDSEEKMREEIRKTQAFIKKMFSRHVQEHRYYWAAPLEIYLSDMGVSLYRTSNWISEYFGVYRPERLKGLHNERKIIAETGRPPQRFYFGFPLTMFVILVLIFFYLFF